MMVKAFVIVLFCVLLTVADGAARPTRPRPRSKRSAQDKIEGCHYAASGQYNFVRVGMPAWRQAGHGKHEKDCCFAASKANAPSDVCRDVCDPSDTAIILAVNDQTNNKCVPACGAIYGNPTALGATFPDCRGTPVGSSCIGTCDNSRTAQATCNTYGTFTVTQTCDPPCFSGDTRVVVQEFATPVAMRDVRTGQHILCVDSGVDMTTPGALKFCEVVNWIHAAQGAFKHMRVSFQRASGEAGSLTVTPDHLIMRITAPGVVIGSTAGRVTEFGAFETVPAAQIIKNDRIVVMKDPADHTAGYYVTAVTAVDAVEAEGIYVPAVASPYIVADGVVAPLHPYLPVPVIPEPNVYGIPAIILVYGTAPTFTQKLQPDNTPGTAAVWTDPATGAVSKNWPGSLAILSLAAPKVAQGLALNFAVARATFAADFAAYLENPSNPITWEELVAWFDTPGMWVAA